MRMRKPKANVVKKKLNVMFLSLVYSLEHSGVKLQLMGSNPDSLTNSENISRMNIPSLLLGKIT